MFVCLIVCVKYTVLCCLFINIYYFNYFKLQKKLKSNFKVKCRVKVAVIMVHKTVQFTEHTQFLDYALLTLKEDHSTIQLCKHVKHVNMVFTLMLIRNCFCKVMGKKVLYSNIKTTSKESRSTPVALQGHCRITVMGKIS